MTYRIRRQGADLGRASLEELRRRRESGELTGGEEILATPDGDWQPLEALLMPAASTLPEGDLRLQRRLRRTGACILLIGLLLGALAWRYAGLAPEADSRDKQYEYQMEVIGGKTNLFATEVTEGLVSLLHGRRLAELLVALSLTLSAGCFLAAQRLDHLPSPPV